MYLCLHVCFFESVCQCVLSESMLSFNPSGCTCLGQSVSLCQLLIGYICIRLCVSINLLSVFVFVSVSTCFCVCLWVDRGVCPRLFVCGGEGGETGSGTQEPVSYSHSTLSLSSSLAIALYLSLSLCLSSPVLTAQCNQNPKTCSSYTRAGHG